MTRIAAKPTARRAIKIQPGALGGEGVAARGPRYRCPNHVEGPGTGANDIAFDICPDLPDPLFLLGEIIAVLKSFLSGWLAYV